MEGAQTNLRSETDNHSSLDEPSQLVEGGLVQPTEAAGPPAPLTGPPDEVCTGPEGGPCIL